MMEMIALCRGEEVWEGTVTPVCGGTVEEPSICGVEEACWRGVTGLDPGVAAWASGLVVRFCKRYTGSWFYNVP